MKIHADPRNPTAAELEKALRHHLQVDTSTLEAEVVLGGDGYMLQVVSERVFDGVFLGLNAGRVGFLLNDVEDWARTARLIEQRRWTAYGFPVLEAVVKGADGSVTTLHALNDVYLERSTGQTAHLALSIDGRRVVDRLVADGVIAATALGSTAYGFSAGGPVCHPTLRSLSVTPICPHSPRLPPLVLPSGVPFRVEVLGRDRRPVRAVVDGRGVEDVVSVDIGFADRLVHLAWFEGHDFTARLVQKILRP